MPDKRIRPRALTLTLPDRKQPSLLVNGRKYWLRNFSEEGIGVWMPTPPFPLHRGFKLRGDIEIGQEIHPVQLEVIHHSDTIVGLHITQHSEQLKALFHELMKPSVYGDQLERKSASGTSDATGWVREWWAGPGQSELVVWSGEQGMIQAMQVCWLGNWVYRELHKPAQTGELRESRAPEGRRLSDADGLIVHPTANPDTMRGAAQFLAATPKPLPHSRLWQFLETGEQIFLEPKAA